MRGGKALYTQANFAAQPAGRTPRNGGLVIVSSSKRRTRRDAGKAAKPRPPSSSRNEEVGPDGDDSLVLYGHHAVQAAIANPQRRIVELVGVRDALGRLDAGSRDLRARIVDRRVLDDDLPTGAVHQGVMARVRPLPAPDFGETFGAPDAARPALVLDQITDPRNLGAILRSAAAFGAMGVVVHARSTPPLAGALAKAAAGAVETVPVLPETNVARSVERLTELGWMTVGLAGDGEGELERCADGDTAIALVLGAEGAGLRRLVRDRCAQITRIAMPGDAESLNVSVAAGIALYVATRGRA